MQRYGLFDANGKANAFYSTEIHGTPGSEGCLIPEGATAITEQDWQRYLTGKYHFDPETGQCVADPGPSDAERLQTAKDFKIAEINAARDVAVNGGMQYDGYSWDSDEKSRVNLTGLLVSLQAGTPLPDGFVWRTADNIDIPLTSAQFVEFGGAMLAHINAQYVKSWTLKAQVEAAASVADVEAIAWG